MVLGMAVGLSPGDFLLDGDPAPPQKKNKGGGTSQRQLSSKQADAI